MPLKRPLFIWTLVTVFIGIAGCGSLNNSFNTYQPSAIGNLPVEKEAEAEESKFNITPSSIAVADLPGKSSTTNKPCELSPYPPFPPVPELPTRALQTAANMAAIERIERAHIASLRAYIGEAKRLQQKSQLAFYEKCDVISKY